LTIKEKGVLPLRVHTREEKSLSALLEGGSLNGISSKTEE